MNIALQTIIVCSNLSNIYSDFNIYSTHVNTIHSTGVLLVTDLQQCTHLNIHLLSTRVHMHNCAISGTDDGLMLQDDHLSTGWYHNVLYILNLYYTCHKKLLRDACATTKSLSLWFWPKNFQPQVACPDLVEQ